MFGYFVVRGRYDFSMKFSKERIIFPTKRGEEYFNKLEFSCLTATKPCKLVKYNLNDRK